MRKWKKNDDSLTVKIIYKGIARTEKVELPEAFLKADGPQSMESGCMMAVREICQRLYGRKQCATNANKAT